MRVERCVPILLALSACNPPLLDERSSERRVRVDEDRVFTIALPSADRAEPVIHGTAVSFLGGGLAIFEIGAFPSSRFSRISISEIRISLPSLV